MRDRPCRTATNVLQTKELRRIRERCEVAPDSEKSEIAIRARQSTMGVCCVRSCLDGRRLHGLQSRPEALRASSGGPASKRRVANRGGATTCSPPRIDPLR